MTEQVVEILTDLLNRLPADYNTDDYNSELKYSDLNILNI